MAATWLRGDFHAHTLHSDGVLTPAEFLKEADREELDFFAITDHNTWTFPEFDTATALTIIAGVEVTMEYGHFNVFAEDGVEPDWIRELPQPWPLRDPDASPGGSKELLERINKSGLRSSINHPMLYPWEWLDDSTTLDDVRYVEVWNDPAWPENQVANPAALAMWSRWLNAGSRATALGGSDFHTPKAVDRGDGWIVDGHRVGLPRTYVLAEGNNPAAILAAVDARRAYVTMGPTIEVRGIVDELGFGIGDDIGRVDATVALEASVAGGSRLAIEVVRNGVVVASASGNGGAGIEHREPVDAHEDGWMRIDVRDDTSGQVVAFTNPVFFGSGNSSKLEFGDFVEESGWDLISTFARERRPPS
ncbi:MAG: CehA/McbA family metallohydrolase [Acidimicrobiia bacterium]|nr:CehA/McbA family metallohydrolase [Acidimicrobiia bacterium]